MINIFGTNLTLLRKRKGENQDETATALNLSRSTYANYEAGINLPKLDVVEKIIGHFGVSFEDLMNAELQNVGNSEKVGTKNKRQIVGHDVGNNVGNEAEKSVFSDNFAAYEVTRMPRVVTVDHSGQENVIMVPVRARAGYLLGYGDPTFIEQLPSYRLPGLNNGTYRLFEVDGLSMHPTFSDKDIVISTFCENLHEIRDDRVYVVVTKSEGVVVKRVLNRLKSEGKLVLKSDNLKARHDYPDLVLDPEEVLEIWYAHSYMSRNMRQPAELYNRLIDLEGRMAIMEAEMKKNGN